MRRARERSVRVPLRVRVRIRVVREITSSFGWRVVQAGVVVAVEGGVVVAGRDVALIVRLSSSIVKL